MFGLDPFSRPVAIGEILLLLALAAFIGWLLGRMARAGRISDLRAILAGKQADLENCRQPKPLAVSTPPTGSAANSFISSDQEREFKEPIREASFVHADPLLPALTHDDTPELINQNEPSPQIDAPTELPIEMPPLGAPIPEAPLVLAPMPFPLLPDDEPADAPVDDNSETAVLRRIAARAGELNFDRIGRAAAIEADDLKDIVGVGPFLERKLHSLGIYTFRQVANFTKEDAARVNEIIEFFPGRIERDNWVGQAKALYERKYGSKP